jgi:penicillin-binding protein 2
MVNLFSAVANGGIFYCPQLISRIVSPEGKTIESIKPQVVGRISLSATTLEVLRHALWGAVNEAGTGWRARVPGLGISGKTGTAQNPRGQDHAWFVAYAPGEDPRIAMVVFLEHGGHGGSIAALIAGRIFREIFKEKNGDEQR